MGRRRTFQRIGQQRPPHSPLPDAARACRRASPAEVLDDWLANQMLRSETFNSKTKAKGLRVVKWPG